MQVVPGTVVNIGPSDNLPYWTLRSKLKLDEDDTDTLSSLWLNDDPANDATVLGVWTPPQMLNVLGTPLVLTWSTPVTITGGVWPMTTFISPDTKTGDTGIPPVGPHLSFDDATGSLSAVGATGGVFQWSWTLSFQPTVGSYTPDDYAIVNVGGSWYTAKPRVDTYASMQIFQRYDGPGQSSGVAFQAAVTMTSQVSLQATITPVVIGG